MAKKKQERSAAEIVIIMQSVFLIAFGVCGYTASSTIVAAFRAVTDANSSAYIITDNAILTDTGVNISTAEAESIINNFELVCTSCLAIGLVVFVANVIRLHIKK